MTPYRPDSRDHARLEAARWANACMRRQLVVAAQYLVLMVIAATVAVVFMS